MSSRYPSIDIVYEEFTELLKRQGAHVDALDTKASIVIGFTALLLGAAITRPQGAWTWWIGGAVGLAAVSFVLAITAFWVRPFVTFPDPRPFYEEFAGADIEQTRLVLCNVAAEAFERNNRELSRKATLMRWSLAVLIGAIGSALIGFYLGGMS